MTRPANKLLKRRDPRYTALGKSVTLLFVDITKKDRVTVVVKAGTIPSPIPFAASNNTSWRMGLRSSEKGGTELEIYPQKQGWTVEK